MLIRENAGDCRHWNCQVEALGRHYRVVRYDARGFGKSSLPAAEEAYSHHEDLLALLDHLGIRKAHLVGWSMGSDSPSTSSSPILSV